MNEPVTQTFTAIYQQGVLVPLQRPGLQERQAVRLQIVPPRVRVTAAAARRKVNRFLLDNVSYLMGAERPTLVETDRLVWRVPVSLTYPDQGVVGQAGFIDVDAESSEVLLAPDDLETIIHHARDLAAGFPPETTS